MIAMQYRFRLPAGYDMTIIENRVRDNGYRLDNFPDLLMKAWCYSRGNDPHTTNEPLYAPFYLWQSSTGMARFLQSDGFKKLVADFGWPAIDSWPVLEYRPAAALQQSQFARREIVAIAPYSDLTTVSDSSDASDGVTCIIAWDVHQWRRLCFQLSSQPFDAAPDAECYRVGHMSLPTDSPVDVKPSPHR